VYYDGNNADRLPAHYLARQSQFLIEMQQVISQNQQTLQLEFTFHSEGNANCHCIRM
jgi:hypothetical protein